VSKHTTESSSFQPLDISAASVLLPPPGGQSAADLFAHGMPSETGQRYLATITQLSFSDPRTRAYGSESPDRVTRMVWAGSKHNDRSVPVDQPSGGAASLVQTLHSTWKASAPSEAAQTMGMHGTTSSELGAGLREVEALATLHALPAAGGRGFESVPRFGRKSAFPTAVGAAHVLRA
jgi:hypothetical protein